MKIKFEMCLKAAPECSTTTKVKWINSWSFCSIQLFKFKRGTPYMAVPNFGCFRCYEHKVKRKSKAWSSGFATHTLSHRAVFHVLKSISLKNFLYMSCVCTRACTPKSPYIKYTNWKKRWNFKWVHIQPFQWIVINTYFGDKEIFSTKTSMRRTLVLNIMGPKNVRKTYYYFL